MRIIYLPGNSLSNKTWIERIKTYFDDFIPGEILSYDHWVNGRKWIDIKREQEKLEKIVENKKGYGVFAKSIGSILALKGIDEGFFKPEKAIFCGLPYQAGTQEGLPIDEYLKKLSIPTIFIQNEFDPVGSFEKIEKILKNNPPKNYRLIKVEGNSTHDYEDFEGLVKISKNFFK